MESNDFTSLGIGLRVQYSLGYFRRVVSLPFPALLSGPVLPSLFLIQFSSVQFSSVQFNSVQFNSVQFRSVQLSSALDNILLSHFTIHFSSVQFSSDQFRLDQFSSVQFSSVQFSSVQFSCFMPKRTDPQGVCSLTRVEFNSQKISI